MKVRFCNKKIVYIGLSSVFACLALCLLFGVKIARIKGNSMQPLFNDGEYIIYRSRFLQPGRGDVILFKREETLYLKRVYGLPGDNVEISEKGTVLINGAPLRIKNLKIMGETKVSDRKGRITLESNEYFVLGDHRTISKDSRYSEMGNIKKQEIIGISLLQK